MWPSTMDSSAFGTWWVSVRCCSSKAQQDSAHALSSLTSQLSHTSCYFIVLDPSTSKHNQGKQLLFVLHMHNKAFWLHAHQAHASWSRFSICILLINTFVLHAMQALVACLLPLFFCALGDTAEFYFSPIMSLVSQSIPKMRPRFAGGAL